MTKNYFSKQEQACKCCRQGEFDKNFLEKLNKAREQAGIPFVINSGYRCEKHNKEVGGSNTSSHLKGIATDIRCDDSNKRFNIVVALLEAGFTRIGIGKNFIHVDDDKEKAQGVIWLY